uniref:Uncharacterized protein n=1 Tax=Panagrolaimus davidi TaxID=227884 RepID=A0A914QH22_9BILA
MFLGNSDLNPIDVHKRCIGKTQFDFLQLICKFWITENFDFTFTLTKLYKCDARKVTLRNEVISFNDLSVFTETAEDITFDRVTVKHSDGSIVSFENVFKAFINAKKFEFNSDSTLPNITSKTFNELVKTPHFSKLQSMILYNIPEVFDIENFYVYMKKNNTTKFWIEFVKSVSALYKNRLEKIIDEILSTKVFNYKPPFFDIHGLDEEKKNRLFDL